MLDEEMDNFLAEINMYKEELNNLLKEVSGEELDNLLRTINRNTERIAHLLERIRVRDKKRRIRIFQNIVYVIILPFLFMGTYRIFNHI